MYPIQASGSTHIGRRQSNQDAHCIDGTLGVYAVADGMGGYHGGEIASQLALSTITKFLKRNREDSNVTWPFPYDRARSLSENMVDVAVRLANNVITDQRKGVLEKMGTTLAMMVFPTPMSQQGPITQHVIISHMGDSRVYRWRAGELTQLTRDHSLYEQLKDSGVKLPSLEEFTHGNVITKALGVEPKARADLLTEELVPGDRFLICTDGLTGPLSHKEIKRLLQWDSPDHVSQALVEAAYRAGGKDNITAVVVDIGQAEEAQERELGSGFLQDAIAAQQST